MPRRRGRGSNPTASRGGYATSSGDGSYTPPDWAPPDDLGGGGGTAGGSGNITITNINTAIANAGAAAETGPGDLVTGPIGPTQPGTMGSNMGMSMSMGMEPPTMGMMGNTAGRVSYRF